MNKIVKRRRVGVIFIPMTASISNVAFEPEKSLRAEDDANLVALAEDLVQVVYSTMLSNQFQLISSIEDDKTRKEYIRRNVLCEVYIKSTSRM